MNESNFLDAHFLDYIIYLTYTNKYQNNIKVEI